MLFARFMARSVGRGIRVVLGIALIVWGSSMGTTVGVGLAIVGVVALLAGAFNFCLIAPILGGPLYGKAARKPR